MSKSAAPWPATIPEWFVYSLCVCLSWAIRVWPRRVQLLFGAAFGEFALLISGKRRHVVLDNLKIAFPDMSAAERKKMLHRHFRHLGNMMLEYVISITFKPSDLKKWCVTGDTSGLDDALAEGRGVILLGTHMGACDFGIVMTARLGYPLVLVGKRTNVHWVTRLLFGLREIHGVAALPEERVAVEIIRALKRNQIVIFVMDQYMGPPEGVASKFFGRETGTSQGVAVFADKLKVPVVPVMATRRADGRFDLDVRRRLDLDGLSQNEITQACNDEIEAMVRVAPEQWFWVHKRWKPFAGDRSDDYAHDLGRALGADLDQKPAAPPST